MLGYQALVTSSLESRVTLATLAGSGALSVALLAAYILYGSQLAFAQFADSSLDVVTATVLAWTVRVSARPEDADHHFGHQRAQPLGALVTAVLTGVLAVEVVHRALSALIEGPSVRFDSFILWCFAVKIAFKSSVWLVVRRRSSRSQPAMSALAVDARNDVLTSAVAVVGFFAARHGAPQLDAWLALPLGLVIGWSGWRLAGDNVRLLMGEAPPLARQQELLALARRVVGVRTASRLRVHYVGTELHAHLEISVDPSLTVGEAHDIGEAVRRSVEAELDVSRCSVHIDPDKSGDPESTR